MSGDTQRFVVAAAHVEQVHQLEESVCGILPVDDGYAVLCFQLGQVFREVEEYRFDGLYLAGLYFLEEGTGCVAVHHDGGNLRLVNLLFVGVFALALVDDGTIIVFQVLVGKGNNFFFRQFGHAVKGGYFITPVTAVDKRLYKPVGTGVVAFQLLQLIAFEVIDIGLQHLLVKVTVAQLFQFTHHQGFYFVQGLSGFGTSLHH